MKGLGLRFSINVEIAVGLGVQCKLLAGLLPREIGVLDYFVGHVGLGSEYAGVPC